MPASRRPGRQRASAPGRGAPGGVGLSLRGVLRRSRRRGAPRGGEDSDDCADGQEGVLGLSRDEGRVRSLVAAECTDRLFHLAKLRLQCPGRWSRLFLAAAKQREARLDRLREATHVAAALDDVEGLAHLRGEVPPALWKWWAYDLGLVQRAGDRCRPAQLEVLPPLFGEAYPGLKVVAARRAALDARPGRGTPQEVQERQRGEALILPLRRALDTGREIDLAAMDDVLNHAIAGPWRTSDVPACGVNYGAASLEYAGWRPLHFAAAAVRSKATAVPALRRLVEARADATLVDDSGGTALHLAAAQGHLPAVEALLEAGAPVEAADRTGVTALLAAARMRQAAVVRRLAAYTFPADAHAEVLRTEEEKRVQQYSPTASTELHAQVAKGDLGKVRRLLLVGDGNGNELADVNFADSLGRRPMHTAVHQVSNEDRAADMVRALAAYRADVDAKDSEGQTALHAAVQLQRLPIVRALLRLRAHACLPDGDGRTPLMLAAAPADESRERPAYDGVLVNRPVTWTTVQDVLEWDGLDEPPGPPPRRAPPVKALESGPLWAPGPQKGRLGREEQGEEEEEEAAAEQGEDGEGDEEAAGGGPAYSTEADAVRARAEALASLGFDDQHILDAEGRINRGDRIQLFGALFQRRGPQGGPAQAPQPNEKRLRVLWSRLTGPLVQLDLQGSLPPRAAEVLRYLLLSTLGGRGAVFALLAAANSGVRGVGLPLWGDFEAVLASCKKAAARADAVLDFAFRGPLPKRTLWVGSAWNRDEYPREPDSAPWEGFAYVSRDRAEKLNERNEELSDEAFLGNVLPVFEERASEEAPLVQHRYERLQLANKIFVDEALGLRVFPWEEVPLMLRAAAEDRVRVAGLRLLCPLLEEAAAGIRGGAALETAADHRDLLRYVAAQMAEPGRTPEETSEVLRQPFWAAWKSTRGAARAALADPLGPRLATLTRVAELALEGGGQAPPSQASVLPPEQVQLVRRRHSADAFFALRRCGAVRSADDFDDLLISLVAMAPRSFGERFWYLALNLLLWGHAGELLPFFETELRKRLPEEGLELRGPRLLPRGDVLLAASRDADGSGRRAGSGRRPLPAFVHTGAMQTEGPTFVASPAVLPNRIGFVWRSTPPEALVVEALEERGWAREAGFEPGDEVVELNGRRPCELSPEEFSLMMTNRPVRFKLRLRAAQAEALPPGRTDLLRAEVVCADEDALASAFHGLCGAPGAPAAEAGSPAARGCRGAPAVDFRVVHAANDFHRSRREEIFPRAAGVLLTARLAVRFPGTEARVVQQLVEVELVLAFTADARWLADFLHLDPGLEAGPARVRSPGQPTGLGPVRKRPPY